MQAALRREVMDPGTVLNSPSSFRCPLIIQAKHALRRFNIRQVYEGITPRASPFFLAGNRFHTVRRNVAMVERLPDVQVLPYSAAHAPACRALLESWSGRYRETHGDGGGAATSARILELAERFAAPDLAGDVVLIGGRLAAFTFGGEIRRGIGCVFETKSDPEVRGLGYFSRLRFISKLERFVLVNDGSDVGRAGLRQLKDSFRPIEMHAEYRGFQRPAAKTPAGRAAALFD